MQKPLEFISFINWQDMIIYLFFLIAIVLIIIAIVFSSWYNGISPMPTSGKVKQKLLDLCPSDIQGTIYDLGSGWGTLVFPLSRRYPNAVVVGFETSLIPFFVSKIRQSIYRSRKIQLLCRNFFDEDLRSARLVVCYLYPGAMKQLKVKFEKELQPGTFVVSNTFAIPGWDPEKIIEVQDLYRTKIYLYRFTHTQI